MILGRPPECGGLRPGTGQGATDTLQLLRKGQLSYIATRATTAQNQPRPIHTTADHDEPTVPPVPYHRPPPLPRRATMYAERSPPPPPPAPGREASPQMETAPARSAPGSRGRGGREVLYSVYPPVSPRRWGSLCDHSLLPCLAWRGLSRRHFVPDRVASTPVRS
jgi:hypothetical protein